MEFTPEELGWKLYGLYEFSKVGLFNRPFVILHDINKEEELIKKLEQSGFKDNDEVAIRFSKENAMNLPFFLGKFSLKQIAETIIKERRDYIPFVHRLVKTKFSACLYYDSETIFVEIWPGIGASKKKVFNENPDLIKINSSISIARYLKERKVEDVKGEIFNATPFDMDFLISISKKLISFKPNLNELLKIQNPLLCDLNCESKEDINFMGIQKSKVLDLNKINNSTKEYYVVKSIDDLKKYDGSKELFFDIPLDRNNEDWITIINVLKNLPKVYVKSLTMHLSIILREFGVSVEKGFVDEDYEIKEIAL